ncbi:unnamed protein product [Paramecium octaurelia]|uniref:Uncharacterized protein n=1 Tax=Paramecium octaurelia TaxID=43137 RepID=A0A8S1VQM4_PAROT|nr:unnamed protein product [Paramecium octaurelia]
MLGFLLAVKEGRKMIMTPYNCRVKEIIKSLQTQVKIWISLYNYKMDHSLINSRNINTDVYHIQQFSQSRSINIGQINSWFIVHTVSKSRYVHCMNCIFSQTVAFEYAEDYADCCRPIRYHTLKLFVKRFQTKGWKVDTELGSNLYESNITNLIFNQHRKFGNLTENICNVQFYL